MSSFKSSATGEVFQLSENITCHDTNIIYVVECTKCPNRVQYVGKSSRCLMTRGREHISNVDKGNFENPSISGSGRMYEHFTTHGHSSSHMRIYGIEIVHGDKMTATVRERLWMNKMKTIAPYGLNTYKT